MAALILRMYVVVNVLPLPVSRRHLVLGLSASVAAVGPLALGMVDAGALSLRAGPS